MNTKECINRINDNKKINFFLKSIYWGVYNVFIDSHLRAHGTPKISLLKRFLYTWRYRLAANQGVFLTENERKIVKLKDKHKGERCFIIGNGPSLNSIDLTLLKNEYTFGVNAIYTNFDKMGFVPNYYFVEDIFVAEDRKDEINKFKGSQKFFGNYLKYCINQADDVHWLNVRFRYDEYRNFPHFSTNVLRQLWTGGSVTYLNLQLAYYLGFKEVYMIGFDHSYSIPKDVEIDGKNILSLGDDVNHFNKDYFGKGKRWHDPMVDRMELAYKKAKLYYEVDGRKIYNATVGGHLEVFDRVDYNSLF